MENSSNQLVTKSCLTEPICKINISGYSLDHFKTFNPDGYTILCRLGEVSDGLSYFPKTSRLVLNNNHQSRIINNFEKLVTDIAEDFGISQQAAHEKYVDFFSNTQITVQPTGIQGKFYQIMKSTQNFIPMAYTSEAVSVLKTYLQMLVTQVLFVFILSKKIVWTECFDK